MDCTRYSIIQILGISCNLVAAQSQLISYAVLSTGQQGALNAISVTCSSALRLLFPAFCTCSLVFFAGAIRIMVFTFLQESLNLFICIYIHLFGTPALVVLIHHLCSNNVIAVGRAGYTILLDRSRTTLPALCPKTPSSLAFWMQLLAHSRKR